MLRKESWRAGRFLSCHGSDRCLPKNATRRCSGQLSVSDDRLPVYENVRYARGIPVGGFEAGTVPHAVGVEDDQVGRPSRPELAPVPKAETAGGEAGHFEDRFGQGKEASFPDVKPQDPGKCAVAAGVDRLALGSARIQPASVGAHSHLVACHDGIYIFFGK